jgi:hypothetical protein
METATVHEQEGKKRICTDHFVVLLNGRCVPRHSLYGVLPHLIQHSPLIARAYLQRQKGNYDRDGCFEQVPDLRSYKQLQLASA